MLSYLAQGANSSIEDGGVLGRLLGSVESKLQLPQAIKLYEQLRKAWSEAIVRETFHHRNAFHMLDGPQQKSGTRYLYLSLERKWRANSRVDGPAQKSNRGCMVMTLTKKPMPRWKQDSLPCARKAANPLSEQQLLRG